MRDCVCCGIAFLSAYRSIAPAILGRGIERDGGAVRIYNSAHEQRTWQRHTEARPAPTDALRQRVCTQSGSQPEVLSRPAWVSSGVRYAVARRGAVGGGRAAGWDDAVVAGHAKRD